MNCKEVQDRLGEILDHGLATERREEILAHLNACDPCRVEFEIESLAKNLVRSKIKRVETPLRVSQSVREALHSSIDARSGNWPEALSQSRVITPTLAAGVAIVLLFFFLSSPSDEFAHTADNDIIRQSLNNFSLIQSGELRPSMVACYPEVVVGYFRDLKADFAVSVLSDDSCEWYGAIASTYNGVKLAHVVYKREDDLLYVYEVRKGEALQGSILSLPEPAKKALVETGWYTDPQHEHCSVILWTVNETLCAAVSTMKKDRLLAFLTTKQSVF